MLNACRFVIRQATSGAAVVGASIMHHLLCVYVYIYIRKILLELIYFRI